MQSLYIALTNEDVFLGACNDKEICKDIIREDAINTLGINCVCSLETENIIKYCKSSDTEDREIKIYRIERYRINTKY